MHEEGILIPKNSFEDNAVNRNLEEYSHREGESGNSPTNNYEMGNSAANISDPGNLAANNFEMGNNAANNFDSGNPAANNFDPSIIPTRDHDDIMNDMIDIRADIVKLIDIMSDIESRVTRMESESRKSNETMMEMYFLNGSNMQWEYWCTKPISNSFLCGFPAYYAFYPGNNWGGTINYDGN